MTTLRTVGRTDVGQLRENNEDVIVTGDRLVLVADGMGGHPGGEVAAEIVAGLVPAAFTGQSVDELQAAVRAANWAIQQRAVAQPGLEGMGTTVCAAGLLTSGHVALVNVGDSRAYLFRGGSLTRLTQDHSLTAELIDRGELREEEATQHPYYGILTRALGVGSDVDIDQTTLAVEEGDRIVLRGIRRRDPERLGGRRRRSHDRRDVDRQGHRRWRSRQRICRDCRSGCLRIRATELRMGVSPVMRYCPTDPVNRGIDATIASPSVNGRSRSLRARYASHLRRR
jgi:Protein phosphatase 2C